jgi:hypothetical protein
MDQHDFDRLARSLGAAATRRRLGCILTGAGLGTIVSAFTLVDVDARAKHGRKKKKKRRRDAGPPVAPPPGTLLTYQCPGPKNSAVSGNGDVRFAQTFVAERSGSLRQIQFGVEKKTGTAGDYVVQLLKVVGGKPSHNPVDVLATVIIPDASVPTSDEGSLTAVFAGPALVAGTSYAAAFSRPGVAFADVKVLTRNGGGAACGGQLFLASGGDPFFPEILAQDALVSVVVL